LSFAAKYAVVTLQPPRPKNNGTDANLCKDLVVDGNGTELHILQGDVGTNTSAATTNKGLITLASGYTIHHYDDLTPPASCGLNSDPTWTVDANGDPKATKNGALIPDPDFMRASFATAPPPFGSQAAGVTPCTGAGYPVDAPTLNLLTTGRTVTCYLPGIYSKEFDVLQNTDVAYLMPGAYRFLKGMKMHGGLAGGLIDSQPGVVLEFPQTEGIDTQNGDMWLLNTGSASCMSDGCRASPALDFASPPKQVKTPEGLVLTIEIWPRDESCFTGLTPIDSGACTVNQNDALKLAGQTFFRIAGVIYGPSDNMQITGGADQGGFVGQIYSWTVMYAGHAVLNQSYPGGPEVGILRIDPACSAPGEPCVLP
jgi:hypothetical protein